MLLPLHQALRLLPKLAAGEARELILKAQQDGLQHVELQAQWLPKADFSGSQRASLGLGGESGFDELTRLTRPKRGQQRAQPLPDNGPLTFVDKFLAEKGFVPTVKADRGSTGADVLAKDPTTGAQIGHLLSTYDAVTATLSVSSVQVDEAFRGLGLSTTLPSALGLHLPRRPHPGVPGGSSG